MATDASRSQIVIFNDTQEILDLMRDLLEEEGYRVSTFVETLDLERLKSAAPDIIVQDLLFEGMQAKGWKFLTMARLDPEIARIPLVLCTAATRVVNDEKMAEQLDRLGVRVLLKPFDLEDLLTVLREVRTSQDLIEQAIDG